MELIKTTHLDKDYSIESFTKIKDDISYCSILITKLGEKDGLMCHISIDTDIVKNDENLFSDMVIRSAKRKFEHTKID